MNQTGHNHLPFLAAEINENFDAFCAAEDEMKVAWVRSLDRALATGEGLRKAKTDVKAAYGHGEWEKWRSANCPRVDKRWAQVLMRLAEHRAYVERRIAETTKCAAAAYLSAKALDREITEMLREAKPWVKRERPDRPVVTQPGDFWMLASHYVTCEDSAGEKPRTKQQWPSIIEGMREWLDPELVEAELKWVREHPGVTQELLLTDPPYGDELIDGIRNNHIADWRAAWRHYRGDGGFVFAGRLNLDEVIAGLKSVGFEIREQIVWRKRLGHLGKRLQYRHENIFYVEREGTPSRWVMDNHLESVLEGDVTGPEFAAADGHATPKPIRLLTQLIKAASKPGDCVFDPFAGTGSTLIAAELTGRQCHANELEPFYCDVIIRRWQKLTRGQAYLIMGQGLMGGKPILFDDLAADPSLRRC